MLNILIKGKTKLLEGIRKALLPYPISEPITYPISDSFIGVYFNLSKCVY